MPKPASLPDATHRRQGAEQGVSGYRPVTPLISFPEGQTLTLTIQPSTAVRPVRPALDSWDTKTRHDMHLDLDLDIRHSIHHSTFTTESTRTSRSLHPPHPHSSLGRPDYGTTYLPYKPRILLTLLVTLCHCTLRLLPHLTPTTPQPL